MKPKMLMESKTKKHWKQEILSLGLALLAVLAIRSVLIEPFKIPSGSMIPTLFIGDYVFVNKMSYGIHLPYTEWLGGKVMLTEAKLPKRGDVAVFLYPLDESLNYIKRVVALPGDRIEMRETILFLNGSPLPQTPVLEAEARKIFDNLKDSRFSYETTAVFEEELDGKKFHVFYQKQDGLFHDFPEITIPAGHFFAMGDDRDFSKDSRFWGPAPLKNLKGRAMTIWFSLSFGTNEQPGFRMHLERLGTLL